MASTEPDKDSRAPGELANPVAKAARRSLRAQNRKSLILRSTAVLPAMFTLGNGLFGFGAIYLATHEPLGHAGDELMLAAWFIFLAMVCDMLDGRLARWARKTSDFGAQLDSLCDAISFGVAPGILMLRTTMTALQGHIERIDFLPGFPAMERVLWCVAGAYMACAVLRLARFNVENVPDESAHMNFRGLPSPGAAAVVAALILLFVHLKNWNQGWRSDPMLLAAVGIILPVATLIAALLMVSRFKYPHVVNQYIRGKRPFTYIVKLLLIVLAAVMDVYITVAVVTLAYSLSGPIGAIWRKLHKTPPVMETTGTRSSADKL